MANPLAMRPAMPVVHRVCQRLCISLFAFIVVWASAPTTTHAFWGDWLPRLFRPTPFFQQTQQPRPELLSCHFKNVWGNCIVYSLQEASESKEVSVLSQEETSGTGSTTDANVQ